MVISLGVNSLIITFPFKTCGLLNFLTHVKPLPNVTFVVAAFKNLYLLTRVTSRGGAYAAHQHSPSNSVLENPFYLLFVLLMSASNSRRRFQVGAYLVMQFDYFFNMCPIHSHRLFLISSSTGGLFCFLTSVLYRIARTTGADILDSIDRLMSNPSRKSDNNAQKSTTRLGVCNHFEVRQLHLPDVSRKKALSDPNGSVISISSTTEQTSISNDEDDKNLCSDLAIYLQGRLLSVSPSVEFRLPYLASREGQLSYLYPYYTYVIDWPLGRRLNDLMKRREKVSLIC
ncbi:unnamed protein product [Schistosoma curassoni]|uniref:Pecanex-like protein n=1 Tax=Schistosoma curassoni TaxID=6186 RepID=A0A183KW54_9TREM|nr:unnamed protein product [Schistosoma curassoni]